MSRIEDIKLYTFTTHTKGAPFTTVAPTLDFINEMLALYTDPYSKTTKGIRSFDLRLNEITNRLNIDWHSRSDPKNPTLNFVINRIVNLCCSQNAYVDELIKMKWVTVGISLGIVVGTDRAKLARTIEILNITEEAKNNILCCSSIERTNHKINCGSFNAYVGTYHNNPPETVVTLTTVVKFHQPSIAYMTVEDMSKTATKMCGLVKETIIGVVFKTREQQSNRYVFDARNNVASFSFGSSFVYGYTDNQADDFLLEIFESDYENGVK